MQNNLWKIIRRKGFLETCWHCALHVKGYFLGKITVSWLRLRGYDIDISVTFRGLNKIMQSRKNAIHIGKKCEIGFGTIVHCGFDGTINLQESVGVYDYVVIDIQKGLEIGENTLIAPFCYITDYDHVFTKKDRPIITQGYKAKSIIIGKNAWIGAKVILLKGVHIGDNSVIGAGSVVTRDIPPNSIAVGNPARVIREIDNR